jgi:hypothetical protein
VSLPSLPNISVPMTSEKPMIAFNGVRSSCDMLARKVVFASLAPSA